MNKHDKITFAREYCRCRRIPYRIVGETLVIGNKEKRMVCYSLYNLTYSDIIQAIDSECIYDSVSTSFLAVSNRRV